MKVLQLNLNHCVAAQDLLQQTIFERKYDLAILCEQHHDLNDFSWAADETQKAAIWVTNGKMYQEKLKTPKNGFTWLRLDGIYFFSCYIPPSWELDHFERTIIELVAEARVRHPAVIAGDFNAWSTAWGSTHTNTRGRILTECMATLNMELLNNGEHTFEVGDRTSAIDLTFVHSSIARYASWTIEEVHTQSDHRAITFEINNTRQRKITKAQTIGWKQRLFDEEVFLQIWSEIQNVNEAETADTLVKNVTTHIVLACDAAMPRKSQRPNRAPAYWWNENIASLRRSCHRARRVAQRARNQPNWESLYAAFKHKRKQLKEAIANSKKNCADELRANLDIDPWGKAYKLAMSQIKGPKAPQPTEPLLMHQIVTTLFPPGGERSAYVPISIGEIPAVTTDEILSVVKRISDKKAPGLDGIPNVALKAAMRANPDIFANIFTACLNEGRFPDPWKRQRLVLLLKPGKQPDEPSAFRPLCMLDPLGKAFEAIIVMRLQETLEGPNGLSPLQFGFRRGRSTIDAIQAVMNIAQDATSGTRWRWGDKKYCAVITLDIRNAFNSASWPKTIEALCRCRTPKYLIRVIADYLKDRWLYYDTDDGVKKYKVSRGVPQGSVLGPSLWNIMYDEVLRIELPEDTTIIGYADDIALVVVEKTTERLQLKCTEAIDRVMRCLNQMDLKLATEKTEAVLLSTRKIREVISFRADAHDITSQPCIKYLGVLIDTRMSFKDHLIRVSDKAAKVNGALSRVMSNHGGPRASKRKILAQVSASIMLYAAPVWADAMAKATYVAAIKPTYRLSALRVASAFRTVSDAAILVIAGMPPIDLIARELQRIHTLGAEASKEEERRRTVQEWQRRWQADENGRWTFTLIPEIESWISRKHGEVDFYLTQILSGHGCFKYYLYRFRHEDNPFCPVCPDEIEDARHVLFYCPRFNSERAQITAAFGEAPSETNLVPHMCHCNRKWQVVKEISSKIMIDLRIAEQRRRTSSADTDGQTQEVA